MRTKDAFLDAVYTALAHKGCNLYPTPTDYIWSDLDTPHTVYLCYYRQNAQGGTDEIAYARIRDGHLYLEYDFLHAYSPALRTRLLWLGVPVHTQYGEPYIAARTLINSPIYTPALED